VEVNGERKASMLCWFQSLRQPQQRQIQRLNHFSSKFSLSFGLFQKHDFQAPKCSGSFRKSLFLFSKKKKANEPKIVQKCRVAESRARSWRSSVGVLLFEKICKDIMLQECGTADLFRFRNYGSCHVFVVRKSRANQLTRPNS
jgi:hypothetical protein